MRQIALIIAVAASAATVTLPMHAAAESIKSQSGQGLAAQLVDLTIPEDVIRRDTKKAYSQNFRTSFLRDPRARAETQQMPDLLDTMVKAAESELEQMLDTVLPQMKAQAAASYADNLTPEELRAAIAFYSGPVGKKMVAAIPEMFAGKGIDEILNPDEQAAAAAFSLSPAGQKFATLRPQQTRDILLGVTESLGSAVPQIEAAAVKVGKAHMRTHAGGE